MAKPSVIFLCSACDAQFPKWSGRCTECGKWGTVEQGIDATHTASTAKNQHQVDIANVPVGKPVAMNSIAPSQHQRMVVGINEFDRVVGGGIVPGSLVLLAGDPGIGKSTLVAQVAAAAGKPTLYVSGEESADQIKMRLDRLHLNQEHLLFLAEEHIEVVCKTIMEQKPALVIIDSIQTVASSAVDSEPGSVTQIKAATVRLLEVAKSTNIPVIIIGHVTKGGDIGGPKTLEHMVDTVLYVEGDRNHQFRLLRTVKNRFGSTNEVGVFQMSEHGMEEVANPSELFLEERAHVPGSCVTPVVNGNRIFLIEVQALVTKTSFGFPQRKSSGFDLNRLHLLLGVLSRRAGIDFDAHDVYVNVVGGSRFTEPGMDLAICMALVSALHDAVIPTAVAAWGEVGLGGEIRSVSREAERTKEIKRFGLTTVLSPKTVKIVNEAIEQLK